MLLKFTFIWPPFYWPFSTLLSSELVNDRGAGCQSWEMSSSANEWHWKAHKSFSSPVQWTLRPLSLNWSSGTISFLSFVNWIIFSGDTRVGGTGILDFQILLINNYFQYFAPNILYRPTGGKKVGLKPIHGERKKSIWM